MGTFWGAVSMLVVLIVVTVFALAFKAMDQWFSE
jgi:preprotein translocase subunit SecE